MEPLFLGGHPAIDFLNTSLTPGGETVELIGDGRSFLAWLAAAGLVEAAAVPRLARRFGGALLDDAAARARSFREWARAWIARWRVSPSTAAELRRLNSMLERATLHRELVATPGGHELVDRVHIDAAEQLVGLVAGEVAKLVASEDPALIKGCAGPACSLWFMDRTKARHRRFCSTSACGNRAKVAAFRERQRSV
jgi:predicted RNA-binding Zn ribbon-like protein